MTAAEPVELSFDRAHDSVATTHPSEATKGHEGHIDTLVKPHLANNDADNEENCIGWESEDEEACIDEEACVREIPDGEERVVALPDENNPVPLPKSELTEDVEAESIETEDIEGGEVKEEDKRKDSRRSAVSAGIELFKYLYSTGLLFFCLTLVFAAMFSLQTSLARDTNPAFAFTLFWLLIWWLSTMEGGQGCIVGLQLVDKSLYAESHPVTHKNTVLAHKGDNMERFIVGRQFLVVLVVFLINMCGAPTDGAAVLNVPDIVVEIFLNNGVAIIFSTIILGHLTPQVNAAVCMLDFINTYAMLFTLYVSLGIEFSGLLHSVYLVQITFSMITGKPIVSKEPPHNVLQKLFFWGRVLLSCMILGFCLAVTLKALFDGNSGIWRGVPPAAGVVIFFALLCVVGMMEGMQIAAFALLNVPEEELSQHTVAFTNCTIMFSGNNLSSFLIGRQIFVASCMFVVARIATVSIPEGEPNVFGVSDGFQNLIDTGLLGAVVLTIIGSLAWRIIASLFPLAFMSNPAIYMIIRTCLFLERTGICSASRLLAWVQKKMVGYQPDEEYIGTRGEREAATKVEAAGDDGSLEEEPTTIEETADSSSLVAMNVA